MLAIYKYATFVLPRSLQRTVNLTWGAFKVIKQTSEWTDRHSHMTAVGSTTRKPL